MFQHFNSLCEVNGVLLNFLNAVLSEKITFLRKCLKLFICIEQKFTFVSLREKQSVPTLQFTVQSEWSAASLSKCCSFREKSLSFESALSYVQAFTGNSNAFL